jgi:hypothetical protein
MLLETIERRRTNTDVRFAIDFTNEAINKKMFHTSIYTPFVFNIRLGGVS